MRGLDPIYRQLAFTLGGNPMGDTADGAFLSALVTSILAGVRLALVSLGHYFPAEMLGVFSGLGMRF